MMTRSSNVWISFALFAFFCFFLFTKYDHGSVLLRADTSDTSPESLLCYKADGCPFWHNLTALVKRCQLRRLVRSNWDPVYGIQKLLAPAIYECSRILFEELHAQTFFNADDQKIFLPLLHNFSSTNCNVVTVGIGGDILAERQLQQRHPFCRFFGADPVEASGLVYKELGQFYQVAVSNTSGKYEASVLLNPSEIWKYTSMVLNSISLREFLTILAQIDMVDYLLLDAEGAEYKLLSEFYRDSDLLIIDQISICQINVELHGPVAEYGLRNSHHYSQIVIDFLEQSDYLPLWSNPSNQGHQRLFLINTEDRRCVEKFFQNWCY